MADTCYVNIHQAFSLSSGNSQTEEQKMKLFLLKSLECFNLIDVRVDAYNKCSHRDFHVLSMIAKIIKQHMYLS